MNIDLETMNEIFSKLTEKKGYAKKIKKSNFVAIPSKKRNNHGLIVTTLENRNLTIIEFFSASSLFG
jgi:hypothetical protein